MTHALIGLQAYFLHYDQSKSAKTTGGLLAYTIALNDVHNFWLPLEKYRSLFREDYLNFKLPIDDIEIDAVLPLGPHSRERMGYDMQIGARKRIDIWKDRNFPETRAENLKILDDYLTLCEENNIVPIIFLPPSTEGYKKHFSKQKLEECLAAVHDALHKHKTAKFLNGWQLQGLSDLTDFIDIDHLNINGATKFSYFFNDFIEQF